MPGLPGVKRGAQDLRVNPSLPPQKLNNVNHPVQAGGGPTGTELAAELNDLVSIMPSTCTWMCPSQSSCRSLLDVVC